MQKNTARDRFVENFVDDICWLLPHQLHRQGGEIYVPIPPSKRPSVLYKTPVRAYARTIFLGSLEEGICGVRGVIHIWETDWNRSVEAFDEYYYKVLLLLGIGCVYVSAVRAGSNFIKRAA